MLFLYLSSLTLCLMQTLLRAPSSAL
uniref:Uncharacterized protein n=1 Tax=Arundo donax TaxID=35708 RepID=A0A0A9ACP7_ARUDO